MKEIVNFGALKSIYYALFHSNMSYAIVLWGNSPLSITIFRLQKRALRVMLGLGCREHCRLFFIENNILTLPCIFIYFTVIEIHSNRSDMIHQYHIHKYNTRTADLVRTRRFRLTKTKNLSINISLYNHLPQRYRTLCGSAFKTKVKKLLLRHAFYSTNEFLEYKF